MGKSAREKSLEKGTITLPLYWGKPSMFARKGTEPGTHEAAKKPMMPIIAKRPFWSSTFRRRALDSSDNC